MPNSSKATEQLYQTWLQKRAIYAVKANPFEEFPDENLWSDWEQLCLVQPARFALVNVELPSDLAYLAQVILATSRSVPHIATYQVGTTLDFVRPKISNKIQSWNISADNIKWIPRRRATLDELQTSGFRLIGTSPNEGSNAMNFQWGPRDVVVIGGAKGLSQKNISLMDEIIKIPCSPDVPFLTIPTVVPILAYSCLNQRGLWQG